MGNFLAALDYGDSLPRGEFSAALWWKVPLGYLVPFLVATCGNRIAASGEGLP